MRFGCTKCHKSYKNKGHLRRHQKYECKAVFRPRLVCEVCFRTYKTQRDLRRHQTYECNKEPQFQCPHCPYKAKLKNTLKTHVIAKHSGPYMGDGSASD